MLLFRLFIAIFTLSFSTALFAQEKLVFAIDLIRHGDRTPTNEMAKSPHHWPEGLGELTATGKMQEQQLGMELRRVYVDQYHLLPKKYLRGTLYVRSTDMSRTIASAHAFLRGLYPQTFNAITVNTSPKSADTLLMVKPSKNIFSLAKLYWINHQAWKDKTSPLKNKLKDWQKITGFKLNNFQKLGALADNLSIRQLHHIPLPEGISAQDANQIIALSNWSIIHGFTLPQIYYPMGHEFLTTVKNYFDAAKKENSQLKYVLFSAHDSSILAVMSALVAPLDKNPRYASDLNFALFENKHRYYVKITFNRAPVKLAKCGNTNVCTLEQFGRLINQS